MISFWNHVKRWFGCYRYRCRVCQYHTYDYEDFLSHYEVHESLVTRPAFFFY